MIFTPCKQRRRYVVLCHEPGVNSERPRHWDLMFETELGLLTWALDEPPGQQRVIHATALPIHRAAYLDYEGPISQGRGSVSRWDQGTYLLEQQAERQATLVLEGQRLAGSVAIQRDPAAQRWTVSFSSA